jgi:hypothetical protein
MNIGCSEISLKGNHRGSEHLSLSFLTKLLIKNIAHQAYVPRVYTYDPNLCYTQVLQISARSKNSFLVSNISSSPPIFFYFLITGIFYGYIHFHIFTRTFLQRLVLGAEYVVSLSYFPIKQLLIS